MSITLESVLISDPVDACCSELLVRHGIPVTTKYKLTKEELIKELQKHDGLIVRSETKVSSEVFAQCPNLRVVGRAGTGVDNIDLQAATRNGAIVLNTPGGNSISACELTCAFISALARNVAQAVQSLKEGRWERKAYSGSELQDKTLAVLGMGRIGREVARRMQAYGMRVIAFDPLLTSEDASQLDVEKLSLDEIWPRADYITVHTPLIPQTKGLINASTLGKCKKGVRIVNVARGGIVDEEALLNALKAGQCAGAALDVFVQEPPKNPVTLELIAHPKVVATPHLGASTQEAQIRVAEEIAQQFVALTGKSSEYAITGVVNAPILTAAMSEKNAPWIDLSKMLGQLLGRLLRGKVLNVMVRAKSVGDSAMREKTFVQTAVLLGILSGHKTSSGPNLINAPTLAQEIGINVQGSNEAADDNAVIVEAEGHWIKGTVRGNEPLLLSLDDASFAPGIRLGQHISLYRSSDVRDVAQIVNALSARAINLRNLNANGSWTIVETDQQVSLTVQGIETF